MQAKIIDIIFTQLSKNNPSPNTELEYVNNFTLLVAVVLSAQTTDAAVNKATRNLFKSYDTPEKMLACGDEILKRYIKTIGLYNTKAKNIIRLSQLLIEKHNSAIPDTFDELIKLPGVGVKTANVILNCAFNQPTIAVDTHVFRVSKRLGLIKTNNINKAGDELLNIIPQTWHKIAHHLLILHGRYICKSRKPNCQNCCINQHCNYYQNTQS